MIVKRSGKIILGAHLSGVERKAMQIEIDKQMAEDLRTQENNVVAIVLWELHEQLGLGPKRLRRFYDAFNDSYNQLVRHYELDDSDGAWLCEQKLKDIGVNLQEWKRSK